MAALVCKAIDDMCSSLGSGCSEFMDMICPPDKPYPMFLSFTWMVLGIPGVVGAIMGIASKEECGTSVKLFLILTLVNCIIHCALAVYIYYKIANPKGEDVGKSTWDIATEMFFYDPMTLVFFFFWIVALVWNIIGGGWISNATCTGSGVLRMAVIMNLVMYIYLFGGPAVIVMSLFCDCCRDRKPANSQQQRGGASRGNPYVGGTSGGGRSGGRSSGPVARGNPVGGTARASQPASYTPASVPASAPTPSPAPASYAAPATGGPPPYTAPSSAPPSSGGGQKSHATYTPATY